MDNFASEKHFPLLSMQAEAENLTFCHVSLHQGPQNTNEKHTVFPGAARQSIFYQISIVLLHTDQKFHPKCLSLSGSNPERALQKQGFFFLLCLGTTQRKQASFYSIKLL